MDSKTISKPYRHNSQLRTNEEDLNKKTEDTQKRQNQKPNNQLLSYKYKSSYHLSKTALKHASTKFCLLNQENLIFNSRVYQEYIKTYDKFLSRYIVTNWDSGELIIYDSKSKIEKIKTWDQGMKNLTDIICITQLPNGDLFCLGNEKNNRTTCTFLIDHDFHVHELPSTTDMSHSSAIFYNRSIYCFGMLYIYGSPELKLSSRFDLDKNCWIHLCPTPWPAHKYFTVIFKGNIIISSGIINIWRYSIDIDSFSAIPYEFNINEKVMVNADQRLYLIENDFYGWSVYESDIWDEFSWKFVANFGNESFFPGLVSSGIYNKQKESIYILSLIDRERVKLNWQNEKVITDRHYWKFNLNKNVINEEKTKKKKKCRIF